MYKLYSADDMRLTAAPAEGADTGGLTNWATRVGKDVWVDMNEPIRVSKGVDSSGNTLYDDVYPIVDPRASEDFKSGEFPGRTETAVELGRKVAGFKVLKYGTTANGGDPGAPSPDANNNNPAPMPVKWLYVLQDGTMTTARVDADGATLNGAAVTEKNPIKGRIAFWTDDESCKVNINTASQGTYWDVPRVYSTADGGALLTPNLNPNGPLPGPNGGGLALDQPAKGEFQRYPGHPASVSLGEVFGYLGKGGALKPSLPVPTPSPGYFYTAADAAKIEKYYSLTPRILAGGSKGGTTVPPSTLPPTGTDGKVQQPGQGGYWRLYSSVDELLFDALDPSQPPASPTPTGGAVSDSIHRIPNLYTVGSGPNSAKVRVPGISPEMMQKAKFFLTATSSAPEVTMYNTPRVSMWPINDTTQIAPQRGIALQLTPYDKLAQFCATVGPQDKAGYPYYFTRWNSRDQKADFPSGTRLYTGTCKPLLPCRFLASAAIRSRRNTLRRTRRRRRRASARARRTVTRF